MLMSTVMMAARPFLIGMGILFLAFFLMLIYAMLVMAAREDKAYEEYDLMDQARVIQEWREKRKARVSR
ncbi:MAG: hypothetical protein IKH57_16875 [Clostridia bacterium]|nr:hypothetical protein [Clostridia bacterium]